MSSAILRRAGALLAGILLLLGATTPAAPVPVPPRPREAIHDGAGVMRPADATAINALSRTLWERARVAVVVATVPDLGGEPIEDLSIRIAKAWGIGGREEDRGVLLLVARRDRRVRIETGYGVEGYLPDGLVGEIIDREMLPRFREGDLSGGIRAAVERIALLTAREHGFTLDGIEAGPVERQPRRESTGGRLIRLIFSGIFLIALILLGIRNPFLLLLLFGLRGGGRYRSGGGFGGGGFGGSGFGGFGGGGFGGGGASRGW